MCLLSGSVGGRPHRTPHRSALDHPAPERADVGRAAIEHSPPVRAGYPRRVKLVVAIVHHEDAGALVDALLDREFRATRLASSGGFLKQSNATVILGVDDDAVDEVMEIVREACHSRTQVVNPMPPIMEPGEFFMPYPLEVEVGGATVFVLPVEHYERI